MGRWPTEHGKVAHGTHGMLEPSILRRIILNSAF